MRSSSRPLWFVVAGLAACLLFGLYAGSAQAYTDPPVKLGTEGANPEKLASLVVEGSPRTIPGVESTVASQEAEEMLLRTGPELDSDLSLFLEGEAMTLEGESNVFRWAAVPALVLGGGGGIWLGYEGTKATLGLYFAESTYTGEYPEQAHFANAWTVTAPGELLMSDGTGNTYSPHWGLIGHESNWPFEDWVGRTTNNGGPCESELYGDGAPLFSPGWEPFGFECAGSTEYRNYVLWRPLVLKDCSNEEDCPGIEPIPAEQTEVKQPLPPSPEVLAQSIKEELETENYPLYNRFANYLADPHNFPDPRVTKLDVDEKDRRCDRGTPAFENPDQNLSPEPFAKKLETPFTITSRPEGFGGTNIYLHWGTTEWLPAKEGYEGEIALDAWGGWGYRHILAKHGWNATDLEETELALVDDLSPTNTTGTNWRYETPEIAKGKGGVGCTRVVVVDYVAGEGDPRPRGIVTSYNEVK